MDRATLEASLTAAKAQLTAYEAAALALAAAGVQSYLLDTGQTQQRVTRLDLPALQKVIDSLMNRCDVLQTRLAGGGYTGRPAW